MNLLNKLTIKNLKLNKKRTVVTIIGIILSVALITAVSSMYSSLITSLINFEINEKGNYHVIYYDVNVEDINIFRNNRKIDTINITKDIGYAKINSQNEFKPYAFIKAYTKESLNNLAVTVVEGRLPENSNEIVIPTHLNTNGRLKLNVGDEITLDVGARLSNDNIILKQNNPLIVDDNNELFEKIIDTETKTYKIVGIIERPSSSIESYVAPGYTFITLLTNNEIKENVDLFVKYKDKYVKDTNEITANILGVNPQNFEMLNKGIITDEIIDDINNAKYQINTNSYLISLQTNPIKDSGIGGLGIVVTIVIIIIIITSVFCIKNSFDISITEKIRQYGMLRSVGATKKQIKRNVFYEATILGIIGIILGVLSGLFASYILILISNYYLKGMVESNIKMVFSFSIYAIVLAIILGIITIYLSAFRSAKKASKVSLIDSIRNSADIKINNKKIRSPKLIKKIFGIGGEISFKNIKRNKKKYRTTVISIIISVAVFIALTSFMNIAFESVANELNISEYNVNLSSNNINKENKEKFINTTTLNNINNYAIIRINGIEFFDNIKYTKDYLAWTNLDLNEGESQYINIYALGKDQYQKYLKELKLDYNEMKDKGILMDTVNIGRNKGNNEIVYKTMNIYDYNVGDKITGILDNKNNYTLEIGYITKENPFGLKNNNDAKIIISDELYDQISETTYMEILFDSSNANQLQDDIDEMLKEEIYSLQNLEENANTMKNLFTLIGIFLYGFIIVISLIGITNIFNTITTSMELRKQEFAMLKSIGMTNKEFKRMIRLESIFIGLKALFWGIPIGLILSYLIYNSLESGISYELPIKAVIITILAVFILITLIMKYSINKINKQNTIETIRKENI